MVPTVPNSQNIVNLGSKSNTIHLSIYFSITIPKHDNSIAGDFPAFNRFDNIKTAEEVMALFSKKENTPKGGTDLTRVFRDALQPSEKPKSILVITDGSPDDQKSSGSFTFPLHFSLPLSLNPLYYFFPSL